MLLTLQQPTAIRGHKKHTQSNQDVPLVVRTAEPESEGRDHSPVGGWWWGKASCSLFNPKSLGDEIVSKVIIFNEVLLSDFLLDFF